jgi:ATP-dependent Clp endopeptidase proteolytic subunit ClpP
MFKLKFVNNADSDTTTIYVDGTIGRDFWNEYMFGEKPENTIEAFRKKLKEVTTTKLVVVINSYGGDVRDGISIMDELTKFNGEVTTIVEGMTASAATLISQGASKGKRQMSRNAVFLVHQVMQGVCTYLNANKARRIADEVEKLTDHVAQIYANRSDNDKQYYRELMDRADGDGEWLTADQALECGLIDEVIDYASQRDDEGESTAATNKAGMSLLHATMNLPEIPEEKLAASLKSARSREIELIKLKGKVS